MPPEEVPATALVCRQIRLRHFRNFAALDLEFPAAGAAIIGDNGSGKTNLLEAVHYLEIFRSFRGAADEQLVRFGAEAFHARGVFEDRATGRSLEITAAYEPRTRRKRVTVDGVEAERLGDAIGRLGTVIFSPSDVDIVAGAPGERRRYLDIVLSLNVRGYLDALQRYRQVLRQRNALLRDARSSAALVAWDAGLIESGAVVISARAAWVRSHAERFARIYATIGGASPATLTYDSDVSLEEGESREAVARAFEARLERVAQRERERGVSLAGPHRDDLALVMRSGESDVDLRQFGSGGQVRTGAIALRMIEAETVREARGFQPLLLLDDVFAELDVGRSRRILELFRGDRHGQVILTAPKESDVLLDEVGDDALVAPLARWRIAAAEVFT
ncbi:MAG TPA: DNA replication and repair protein RecF [Longimicrobiales bacterium]|nr:DNA replication and repair protein RecF [Longimicrobiales bacterium]